MFREVKLFLDQTDHDLQSIIKIKIRNNSSFGELSLKKKKKS